MLEKWSQNLFDKYCENKLAHAFLLETNNYEKCYNELKKLLTKICEKNNMMEHSNIELMIEKEELPSLITIRSDGNNIKKEQILYLKDKFKYEPVYTEYNIYIIFNAERLNGPSANTMLKFMEEPSTKILGFLITNNKESVMSTIKSRCQIIKAIYKDDVNSNYFKYEDIIKNYIKILESNNDNALIYTKQILEEVLKDKFAIQVILEEIMNLYKLAYENNIYDNDLNYLLNNNSDKLIKKMKLTYNTIQKIQFNVNIEMLLDQFAIEMGKINE